MQYILLRLELITLQSLISTALHFMHTVKHYSELGDDPVTVMNKILLSVSADKRIFRQPNYFSADFRQQ